MTCLTNTSRLAALALALLASTAQGTGATAHVTLQEGPDARDDVLALIAAHRLEGKSKLQLQFDLRNDEGQPIDHSESTYTLVPAQALKGQAHRWTTPRVLPEGFYALRVSALAVTASDHGLTTQDFYFQMKNGRLQRISMERYIQSSREHGPAVGVQPSMCPVTGCDGGGDPPPPTRSGVVAGTFRFFNANGGYCPGNIRDCYDSRYTQLEFGVSLPLQNGMVVIWRASDFLVIGSGTTNAAGGFNVRWTVPNETANVSAYIVFVPREARGQWEIVQASGAPYYFSAGPYTLINGSLQQIIPSVTFGSSLANASQVLNVFDGARRAWDVMQLSNRIAVYFQNFKIKAFMTDCPTSCTLYGPREIHLDPNSAFAPQGRIMHEMGHGAAWVSNVNQVRFTGTSYCYNQSGNCDWSLDSQEYRGVAFEEAMATFLGDVGLNGRAMHQPYTCIASMTYCDPSPGFNEELTPGTAACVANVSDRQPINVIRYIWDIYDTNLDGNGISDGSASAFYVIPDTLASYPQCFSDDHCRDEEFCFGGGYCNPDGRSAEDFRFHLAGPPYYVETGYQRLTNCVQ